MTKIAEVLGGRSAARRRGTRHAVAGPAALGAAHEDALEGRRRRAGRCELSRRARAARQPAVARSLPRRSARAAVGKSRRPAGGAGGDPRRDRAAAFARGVVPEIPARDAEGLPALRPARLRQDAHRQGDGLQPDETAPRQIGRRHARIFHAHQRPRDPQHVGRRIGADGARNLRHRARETPRRLHAVSLHRRSRKHPRHAPRLALLEHSLHSRPDVLHRDGRDRFAQRSRHHPRLEPRRPDRSRDPASGPDRPQNQGRAGRTRRARAKFTASI